MLRADRVTSVAMPEAALDVDTPADMLALRSRSSGSRATHVAE
jgi:hypothetical protein